MLTLTHTIRKPSIPRGWIIVFLAAASWGAVLSLVALVAVLAAWLGTGTP